MFGVEHNDDLDDDGNEANLSSSSSDLDEDLTKKTNKASTKK